MVNIDLLREKIMDRGITIAALSRKTGVSRETIYNRLKGKPGEFTVSQIISFSNALHLTPEERDEIFLHQ